MSYNTLKALVNSKVYENTEQRITGGDMNDVLQSAIASLGAHYQMGGLVSPTDQITVRDEPVVFLATTPGTYTYFGGLVVADGEVALLVWSGTAWSKQTPDISTRTEVNQLGQNLIQDAEDVAESMSFSDRSLNIQDNRIDAYAKNLMNYAQDINAAIDDGKWYVNTGYSGKIIRVSPGEIIEIETQVGKLSRIAVLKNYDSFVPGETPDFAAGFADYLQLKAGAKQRIVIPQDGNYLFVINTIAGGDYYPAAIKNIKNTIFDKADDVDELKDFVLGKDFIKNNVFQGYISADGNYYVVNDGSYTFALFRVFPNQKIKITAQSGKFARYTLLAEFNEYYNDIPAQICEGCELEYDIPQNTSSVITMPQDAKYLIVYDNLVNSSYYPTNIELTNPVYLTSDNFDEWMVEKTADCISLFKHIGGNKYIKYPIQYYQSAFVSGAYPSFYDCWDMDIVKLCHLEGGVMIEDYNLFREGLAECAISVPRGDGQTGNVFVGGGNNGHGFENIIEDATYGRDCRILVNKQKIAENAILNLQKLVSFSILQRTQMFQSYSNSDPFARLVREWTIENGALKGIVSVTFLRAINVANMYIGMMCVYRHKDGDTTKPYITNKAITSDNPFYVYDLSNSPSYVPISPYRNKVIEYGEVGLGFAESIEDSNKLESGGMFVSDNGSTYNKIYFSMGSDFATSINQNLHATFKWEIE